MSIIVVEAHIKARVETVWNAYNSAEDIMQWNQASDDWHCTGSVNDLRVGGKFSYRMEAKDGSLGFDFEGVYTELVPFIKLVYVMPDKREVTISFATHQDHTHIMVRFEPEQENPIELQQEGWQAILDSFKNHVETFYKD